MLPFLAAVQTIPDLQVALSMELGEITHMLSVSDTRPELAFIKIRGFFKGSE